MRHTGLLTQPAREFFVGTRAARGDLPIVRHTALAGQRLVVHREAEGEVALRRKRGAADWSWRVVVKIPTAAGTNSSVNATCAPMMNDQMPPNFIVPPVPVIPCSPRWTDAPVAFNAGSRPIRAAATSASSSA